LAPGTVVPWVIQALNRSFKTCSRIVVANVSTTALIRSAYVPGVTIRPLRFQPERPQLPQSHAENCGGLFIALNKAGQDMSIVQSLIDGQIGREQP
jgi:hypothetical protein